MEHEIALTDMSEWQAFAADNKDALIDAYGSVNAALKHACDGGLTLGGGAAPMFHIYFAE